MSKEEWRQVVGYDGLYEVSNIGRIKSRTNWRNLGKERIMKPTLLPIGYECVRLRGKVFKYVHRLVLESFVGPCPPGKEVNHKDSHRANNILGNLEYVTHFENIHHAMDKGRIIHPVGEKASKAKLTRDQVLEVRALRKTGLTLAAIANKFGITNQSVDYIVKYRNWRHVP